MKRYGLRTYVYSGVGWCALASGFAGSLVAALLKADPKNFPPQLRWLGSGIISLQQRAWFLVPGLAILTGLFVLLRKNMGEPWVWSAIHDLIDGFRDFVFSDERGDPLHFHRVTLFRNFNWWQYPCFLHRPFSRRLIPVERSGHLTQKSSAAFQVPDDADKVEGVAGQAWSTFKTLLVSDLPDLHDTPSDADYEVYAKKTWVPVEWVRQRKPYARSLCGIPIRVQGKPWGVIIIDSRSARAIKRTEEAFYDLMGRSFGKLLERV